MTEYLSGAAVISDARLRLAAMGPDQAIMIVEGRDDVRLWQPYLFGLETVIPCGKKRRLLDAFARLRPGEERQFLFVTDCDYDVPAQRLRPAPNLLLTTGVDVEADLLALGLIRRLVLEVVPDAVTSEDRLRTISDTIRERAEILATAVGRVRHVSAVLDLGLSFGSVRHRRYRTSGTGAVDQEKLARVLHNGSSLITVDELLREVAAAPKDCVCHGKDLLACIAVVAHEDFGVPKEELRGLAKLLRSATTPELLESWPLVRRIHDWEVATGRRVLR